MLTFFCVGFEVKDLGKIRILAFEGQNRKAPNLHFTAQAAEWMPSISEKSSIWEKFGFEVKARLHRMSE